MFKRISIIILGIVLLFGISGDIPVRSAQQGFTQTDWSDLTSPSSDVAALPKAAWKKYAYKSPNVATENIPGDVYMTPESFTKTYDATDDFNGTPTNATIGNGKITLNTSVTNPFVTGLGKWVALPAMPELRNEMDMIQMRAGGDIYYLWFGGDNRTFGKYNIQTKQWTFLTPIPMSVGVGAGITFDGDHYIYVLRGGATCEFYQYDINTNAWAKKKDIGSSVTTGGCIAFANGYVYATPGRNNASMWAYNPAGDSWSSKTSPRDYAGPGATMVWAGGSYLYMTRGACTNEFWRFTLPTIDVPNGSWDILSTPPVAYVTGCNGRTSYGSYIKMYKKTGLWYPGSGDYLYLNAGVRRYWLKYGPLSSGTPSWTALGQMPTCIGSTANRGILYDPDNSAATPILEYLPGSIYTEPWQFDTSTDKWMTLVAPPPGGTVGTAGNLCYPGTGNYIYYTCGSGYGGENYQYNYGFYRYDYTTNTWEKLTNLPFALNARGSQITYFDNYIYVTQGNDVANTTPNKGFARYNVSDSTNTTYPIGTWETLPDLPQKCEYGGGSGSIAGALVPYDNKKYIYCVRGKYGYVSGGSTYYYYSYEWWRYDIEAKTWSTSMGVSLPSDVGGSISLVYVPYKNSLYLTAGKCDYKFYRYELPTSTKTNGQWYTDLPNTPFRISAYCRRSPLVYLAGSNYLYLLKSRRCNRTSNRMARFNLDTGSWSDEEPPQFRAGHATMCATSDTLYAIGKEVSGLFKCDVSSPSSVNHKWTSSVNTASGKPLPVVSVPGFDDGTLVYTGGDIIYVFYGSYNISTSVWKYSISQKRFTGIVRLDPSMGGLSIGSKAFWMQGTNGPRNYENFIYVIKGRGSKDLWRYDMTTDSWMKLMAAPMSIDAGCRIAGGWESDGYAYIYAIAGDYGYVSGKDRKMMKYDIAGNSWIILNSQLPAAMNSDASNAFTFARDTAGIGKLYCMKTQGTNDFWIFDPSESSWADMSSIYKPIDSQSNPVYFNRGSCLYYPGSDNKVYALAGENATTFLTYNTDSMTWASLKDIPLAPDSRPCSMVLASDGLLYVFNPRTARGGNGPHLFIYSPTTNTWNEPAYPPATMGYGGNIVGVGDGETLFYVVGEATNQFYKYTISTDTWAALPNTPDNIDNWDADAVYSPYDSSIYLTRGSGKTGFYRYSINSNAWTKLSDPSVGFTWGAGNSLAAAGHSIYALAGGGKNNFYRFNIANPIDTSDKWDKWLSTTEDGGTLPAPTVSINRGACLVVVSGDIYCLAGGGMDYFRRYNIQSNVWAYPNPTRLPLAVYEGHSKLVYPGFGDNIYYMNGSGYCTSFPGSGFLVYNKSLNTWAYNTDSPIPLRNPGTLVYPGGSSFFLHAGRDNFQINKYLAYCFGSYVSTPETVGTHSGFGTISWTLGGVQPVTVKVRTANKSDMSDASDWTGCPTLENMKDLSGFMTPEKEKKKYLQYQLFFMTDNVAQPAALDSLSFVYEKYPVEQVLVSSILDTGFDTNRLLNLRWTEVLPFGTDIRVQLKTAATSGGFTDVNAGWLGPMSVDQKQYFDYTIDNPDPPSPQLYVSASQIKMDGTGAKLCHDLEDYKYSQVVMIDNKGGTEQTDAMVTIYVAPDNAHFWANIRSDCNDIRFHDGTNKLSYYLAHFDYAKKEAYINVKIPALAADATPTINMLYGSSTALSESNSYAVTGLTGVSAWWRFDEGWGTEVKDYSGHNFDAKVVNGGLWTDNSNTTTTSNFGQCVEMDGINDYVQITTVPDIFFRHAFSIELWCSWRGLRDWATIFDDTSIPNNKKSIMFNIIDSKSANRQIWLYKPENNYRLYADFRDGQPATTCFMSPDVWYHMVLTWDATGKTKKVYVNKSIVQTSSLPDTDIVVKRGTQTSGIWLGRCSGGTTFFNGAMDEVRLYDHALSQTEVNTAYGVHASIVKGYARPTVEAGDSGFTYRIPIQITNNGADTNTAVPVEITIRNWEQFWQTIDPTRKDMKFKEGSAFLHYWIQNFKYKGPYEKSLAKVVVEVPRMTAGQTRTVYLYFGNPSYTNESDDTYFRLFNADFTGTIDTANFSYYNASVQSDAVRLMASGSDGWGNSYLSGKASYGREISPSFRAKVQAMKGTRVMIGWRPPTSGTSYSNMPYALYFSNGSFYIYEDGTQRGYVGTYKVNEEYYVRIDIKPDMGATYYYRPVTSPDWILLYDSVYSSITSLTPFIVHYDYEEYTNTDDWQVYKTPMPNMTQAVDYPHSDNTFYLNVYYTIRPTVQPIYGIFYSNKCLSEFIETRETPIQASTGIQYQLSPDGWQWYYWTGSAWAKTLGGWENSNTAATVNTYLDAFQTMFPSGDFYFRAYLDSNSVNTPKLDNIRINLKSGVSYYMAAAGNAIAAQHTDASTDRYFQYRVILYSEGENTPVIKDISLDYVKSYIAVTRPDGDEIFTVGQTEPITWTYELAGDNVNISYSIDGGSTWTPIYDAENDARNIPITNTVFNWIVPKEACSLLAKVRVMSNNYSTVYGVSPSSYQITGLTVTSPKDGDIWETDTVNQITWNYAGMTGDTNLDIYLLIPGQSPKLISGERRAETKQFNWPINVTLEEPTAATIKIVVHSNTAIMDINNGAFTIKPIPTIGVVTPSGGEAWKVGTTTHTIEWDANYSVSNSVKLELYSTDSPGAPIEMITASAPSVKGRNSFTWPSIPDHVGTNKFYVMITDNNRADCMNVSNHFSITEPTLTLTEISTQPPKKKVWVVGDVNNITWGSEGTISNNLHIYYTMDPGSPEPEWIPVDNTDTVGVANTGTYAWTVPQAAIAEGLKIKIIDGDRTQVESVLQNAFEIIGSPRITIIRPNGPSDEVIVGEPYQIMWSSDGKTIANNLTIEYNVDDGIWKTVDTEQYNDGSYVWADPPNKVSHKVRLRILEINPDPPHQIKTFDVSDDYFSIVDPKIFLDIPQGGETWYATGSYAISWQTVGAVGPVKIEYQLNGGAWLTVPGADAVTSKSFAWDSIPDVPSSQPLKFKFTDTTRSTVVTTSGAVTITPPKVTAITSPTHSDVSGGAWVVGTKHNITWTTVGGNVDALKELVIQYAVQGGSYQNVATITDPAVLRQDSGTIEWTVPDAVTARTPTTIKIFDSTKEVASALVSEQFEMTPPTVILNQPVSSDVWRIGSNPGKLIKWTTLGGVLYPIRIYCTTSDGQERLIATIGDPSVKEYPWNVDFTGIIPGSAYLVLKDNHTTPITVQGTFYIDAPQIIVRGPLPGQKWTETDTKTITWSYDGKIVGPLKVEWSKMNFNAPENIFTITASLSATFLSTPWVNIPHDAVCGNNVRIRVTDLGSTYEAKGVSPTFIIFPIPVIDEINIRETDTQQPVNVCRIGNTYDITWNDNGGAISNSLQLEYFTTAQGWRNVNPELAPNSHTYRWMVPIEAITPCVGAQLRIKDTVEWKDGTALCSDPITFEIARPKLTILTPNSTNYNYIALGENPSITWRSDGYITEGNLNLKLVTDQQQLPIATAQQNSFLYNQWIMPETTVASDHAKIVMEDAFADYGGSKVTDQSEEFHIISKPEIMVTSPNTGAEDYVIDKDTMHITWTSKGLSVDKVKIELLSPGAPPYEIDPGTPKANVPNQGGSYDWYIKNDSPAGTQIKAQVTMDSEPVCQSWSPSEVYDVSDNNFIIRSGFEILSPVADEKWATNEVRKITWNTKGTIGMIKIYYNTDGTSNFKPIPEAQGAAGEGIPNTGEFNWKVPNERTDTAGTKARIRIKEASDTEGIIQNDSGEFDIIWYRIKFYVIDKDTFDNLKDLTVVEDPNAELNYPGWNASGVNSPVTHEFPYGEFIPSWDTPVNTTTGISDYFTRTAKFTANPDTAARGVVIDMENRISATIEWHVIMSTSYTPDTDTIQAQVWLERRGRLVEPKNIDTDNDGVLDTLVKDDFKGITLEIYDYDTNTLMKTLTGDKPDDRGVYQFSWASTGLAAGRTYFVKAAMMYSEGKYTSGGTIDVTVAKQHAEQISELSSIEGKVDIIQGQTTDISAQTAATAAASMTIPEQIAEVKAETAKILTATSSTIPAAIEAAKTEITRTIRSEILNRENTVRSSMKLTIRYRTPGTSPVLDLYDAKNIMRLTKVPMNAVLGTEGEAGTVYSYEISFTGGWGKGDFTIVCSDADGNMDALIISVLRTDVEDISSQIAAVLGATSNLGDLKEVADMMNSQFSMIETALSKVGRDLVYEVRGANTNASAAMETVYKQLVTLASQIKQSSGEANLNLGKLYDVAVEKKGDMLYLKNKTQQLKAAMEMNTKMIDNMANKPVTQTWYEYK